MKHIKFLTLVLLLSTIHHPQSTVKAMQLPSIIGDNMLLQQQTNVNLWGTATPGNTISVYATWGEQVQTKVGKDGHWLVTIPTPAASYTEHTLTFVETPTKRAYYNPDPVQVNHVLIGEVWFGCGQSNMEMPLMGFWQCPTEGANKEIATAGNYAGKIRYAVIDHTGATTPQDFMSGKWYECNAFNAPRFGAAGYFFAKLLQQALDIPVGVINCSWGGSRVEGWLPREILDTYPDVDLTERGMQEWTEWMRPLLMHDGMLWPCHYYTVKGWIWYQGCSNIGHADTYTDRMETLVKYARKLWNNDKMPFYFAEIAPFRHGDPDAIWAAELRESQWALEDRVPYCKGISTNDLVYDYEIDNIHPAQKQAVGERFAYLALNHDYGFKTVYADAPRYERHEVNGNHIDVYFTNCADGFSRWAGIQGFEVIDANGVSHEAKIEGVPDVANALRFSAEGVDNPTAVRYCFRNFQIGNLANMRYLPIVPFRTDKQ